jgi:hypothetical protein
MRQNRISRRTMLRGVGGAALALPLLECMLDSRASAAGPPKRYVLCFGGFSITNDEADPGQQAFVPSKTGSQYDLKSAIAPLGGYPDANGNPVRDRITLVSGLSIPYSDSGTAPGGRFPGDSFHFHGNALLAGRAQVDTYDGTLTGPTSDQIVAAAIAGGTTFSSLAYRAQASTYLSGSSAETSVYKGVMSASGAEQPVVPQASPKQAYDTLFTSFAPTDPALAAEKEREHAKRRSVLDHVDRNMSGLMPKLSAWDRARLERHYDEVRALEALLDAPPPALGPGCMMLRDPGPDPALGGELEDPTGWDSNAGYSDEDARAKTFTRLLHMALVCDLTRVVTMMYTMFQPFMNAFPIVGAEVNTHELNHFGAQENLDTFISWHMKHFGELVALLRDTPEAGGSLLDNCAVAFMNEGGDGVDVGEGSHCTDNMAMLVAGGAGGLRQGEHIVAPGGAAHPCNVLLTLMNAVGVEAESLGEVDGTIPELLTE